MVDKIYHAVVFLSTPSARRATRPPSERTFQNQNFYPRPPRGGRPGLDGAVAGHTVFLSTPSARRATTKERTNARIVEFLSTPSARRATVELTVEQHKPEISIHALREEGDRVWIIEEGAAEYFYPRPPRGGRRLCFPFAAPDVIISIHALREEGDRLQVAESAGC